METPHHSAAASALLSSRARLGTAAQRLGAFLAGSEDVFLDTGARLAGLEAQARGLLAGARRAVALEAEGGEGGHPVARLDRELSRLDGYLGATRGAAGEGLKALSRLSECIEAVTRAESAFDTIPPTLRMLGMNTRIENSRASAQNAGMETVAVEVRRLADLVEPRFRAIFEEAEELAATAGRARTTTEAFLGRQREWSSELLSEIRAALEALRSLERAEAEVAARAVGDSDRLARDLGEVLVSLQGHDATRQRIEHVVEELHAFGEDADEGGGDPRGWLAHLPDLSALAAAQIEGARERLAAALDGIARGLRGVSERGAALGEEAGRFAGRDGADGPAVRVARGVGAATRVLRDHVSHEQSVREAMQGVAATVEGIAGHVREIQGFGSAVKIIALNALVETERAGNGGRVLAVLAEEMRELAAEVARRTGELSEALEEISTLSTGLSGGEAKAKAPEGDDIATSLEALSAQLAERERRLDDEVQALHGQSRDLGLAVDGIGCRIGERAGAAQDLQAVEEELRRLGEEAAREVGAVEPTPRPSRRASSLGRYTMEAERTIHARVVKGEQDGGEGEGELGGNVELF